MLLVCCLFPDSELAAQDADIAAATFCSDGENTLEHGGTHLAQPGIFSGMMVQDGDIVPLLTGKILRQ